jgi:mRNA interferase MazF
MKAQRGEIWSVDFQPTKGAEISKIRPAVVMNDSTFGRLPLVVVVPMTDWKPHYTSYAWMVQIVADGTNGLTKDSAADTFQTKSCSETRLIAKLGSVTKAQEQEIAAAIAYLVGFECP